MKEKDKLSTNEQWTNKDRDKQTVRQIDKDEELFVWSGYDFGQRLDKRTSEDNWPVVPSTRLYQAGNYTQQPLSVEVS